MNTVNPHCTAESHRCKPPASHFSVLTALETNMQSSLVRLLCGQHKQSAVCLCGCERQRVAREGNGVRENSLFWREKECFRVKRPGPEVVPNVGLRLNSTKGKQEDRKAKRHTHTHRNWHNKSGMIHKNTHFSIWSFFYLFAFSCLFYFMCNKYMYLLPI